jgi:hypothetical protein
MSPWAVASGGCNPDVKQLALKGSRAVRCSPPRGGAWLRGRKVSPNEASFDLRESAPLPRNMLHSREVTALAETGQRTSLRLHLLAKGARGWFVLTTPRVSRGYLIYPLAVRDTAKSGRGRVGNRHLPYLVESLAVNVGGSRQTGKGSSLPRSAESVGGVIVLGARESRV